MFILLEGWKVVFRTVTKTGDEQQEKHGMIMGRGQKYLFSAKFLDCPMRAPSLLLSEYWVSFWE
jgi:hypothetical protein